MTNTEKLHLMTQRNQPYGSVRKCCELCGLMMQDGLYYVGYEKDYTEEVAKEVGCVLCSAWGSTHE